MHLTQQAGALLGGIGLFLLGMWLMTEGLRLAAGAALRDVLARSTRTRWRALASGVMLTALVQSSSAVTVAAIGFVNAGLLSLGQVLWVLFGSNVGTTMTGWLVAALGLQFKVELLSLPLIGAGMMLRLTGGQSRRGHLGLALAGFGVLFLGIDVLREAFSGLADGISFPPGEGMLGVLAPVAIGALLTLLMQSSSAATALTLTAAMGGLIGLEAAAAVVIGANVGTTGTAAIAAIGATANARRSAAAHVLFNLLTAAVALLALPWLLVATQWLGEQIGAPPGVATAVALFHTLFNVLGVILMWPLSDRLASFLMQRFRTREEDEGQPRFLDDSITAVPALAVEALSREVSRYGGIALRTARRALRPGGISLSEVAGAQRTLLALDAAIDAFVVRLNRTSMTQDNAQGLAAALRREAYFTSVADQWEQLALPGADAGSLKAQEVPEIVLALRNTAAALLQQAGAHIDGQGDGPGNGKVDGRGDEQVGGPHEAASQVASLESGFSQWESQYQSVKAALLEAAAMGRLAPSLMDSLLRANSALRRAVQQTHKAIPGAADVARSAGDTPAAA